MQESLLAPVSVYGSETVVLRKKESFRIKGLLRIRRIDRIQNKRVRELCWGKKKNLNERNDETILELLNQESIGSRPVYYCLRRRRID